MLVLTQLVCGHPNSQDTMSTTWCKERSTVETNEIIKTAAHCSESWCWRQLLSFLSHVLVLVLTQLVCGHPNSQDTMSAKWRKERSTVETNEIMKTAAHRSESWCWCQLLSFCLMSWCLSWRSWFAVALTRRGVLTTWHCLYPEMMLLNLYSCLLKTVMQSNKCNYDLQTAVQVLYCSLFLLYCFDTNSICSLALTQLSPMYLGNCSFKNGKAIPVTGRGGP
jgi:hypothetical protein